MFKNKLKSSALFVLLAVCLALSVNAGEEVYLGGFPFGIRMVTEGIYVSGTVEVESTVGRVCPARDAGICSGDVIRSVNGKEIAGAAELADIIADSNGKRLNTEIKRGDKILTVNLIPVKTTEDGEYKTGLFVKDSASGIGTVTYLADDKRSFGGLGHGITDRNTAGVIPMKEGTVHSVEITDIIKGKKDSPGELKGSLLSVANGKLMQNTDVGIFGRYNEVQKKLKKIEIAGASEVKKGACVIYSCLGGTDPIAIEAQISEIVDKDARTKNFIVTVTDKEVLKKAGGIVQGMSGSPIIQNGKLIGAVTHVLMRDQTSGYGIFIENMMAEAEKIK